jgi:hypothetical protein
MAQQLREGIDYMKLKRFCTTKEWPPDWRGSPQSGRKSLLAIHLTGINNQSIQGAQKAKLPKNQ